MRSQQPDKWCMFFAPGIGLGMRGKGLNCKQPWSIWWPVLVLIVDMPVWYWQQIRGSGGSWRSRKDGFIGPGGVVWRGSWGVLVDFWEGTLWCVMITTMMIMPGGGGAGHNKCTVLETLGRLLVIIILLFFLSFQPQIRQRPLKRTQYCAELCLSVLDVAALDLITITLIIKGDFLLVAP